MSESAQKKGRNLLAKFQEHKSASKTTILSSPAASEASEEAYFDAITDGSLLGICYSETKKKNSSSLTLTPGDNDPVHDVDSPLDMVRFALLQLSTMQLSSEQQPYGQSITTMLQGVEDYLERTRLLVGSSPLDTCTDTPHRGMSLLLGLSTTRGSSSRRRSEGKRSSSRKALVLEQQQQSLERDHCDPTSSGITTPTVLQRSQRSILMENQLDLNETEMEYYEQIVNDLAEKLERMKDEKEEIQAISSMLGDRLLKITQQKDELLKSSTEELVQQRAAMEREMADLKSLLEVTRQDYRVELNKVFELESRIQVLRGQLQDTDRKLALATDRNEALTQQITALGGDLQALKGIRDAQTSEGEMLQHQLMQHQVSIKALELQLNQYSQSDQHMTSQLQVLQLKATEVDELRHQVSSLRDSNAYLQESIAQARFRSDDPLREVELADLRELVEDLKAELEDSQAEVDSLSGVVENLRLQLELTSDSSIALEEMQAALAASREEVRRLLAENEALQLQRSNASDAKRQQMSPQYSDRRLDNLTDDEDRLKEHQLNTIRALQRSLERSEEESADRLEEMHRLADEVKALNETVARQQELLQMDDCSPSPSPLQIQMMMEASSPGALPIPTAQKQLTTPHLLEKLIDENEALHERVRGLEAGERLDQLTQSEVEYYEDAINGLAEQLEAVRSEREQLEAENRVAVEEINRLQRGGALSATALSLNDRKDESDFVINDLVEQLEALKEENRSMKIQLQQYSSAMDELNRLKRTRRAAAGGPPPRTDETNQFLGISQWSEDSDGDAVDASATRGEQLGEAANRAIGQMDAQQRKSIQELTDAVQQLRSQKAALKQALNQAALRIEDLLRSNSRLEHDLQESSTQLKIKTEQQQQTPPPAASAAATRFSTPLSSSSRRDRDGDSSEQQSGGSQQSGSSQQQSGRNKSSSQPELRLEQAEARIEALLADLRRAESSYDRMKLDFDKLHIRFQSKLKLSEEQALDIDHLRKEIDALLEENDKLAFKEMKASTSFRLKEIDYDGEVEVLQAQLGEQEALNTSLQEELRSKEAALLVEAEASSSLKEVLRKLGEQNDATEQLLRGLRSDRDSAAAQVEAVSQQLALQAEWVTASEHREEALRDQIEDLQAEVDRLHDHIEGMQVGMEDEAGSLHHRLQVLNDENQSNDESLRTASKRIESLEERCSLCDAELLSTKHLLRTHTEALAQHINRLSYMEAQFIKQVQMKVADQDRRIHVATNSVTTAFVDLNEFIASMKTENEELLRSLDDTKSALDRALDQHELDEDEKQFAWSKYDEVRRQEMDLQEELDRLNDQLALRRDAQSALQDHEEEMARLETRLQQAEQQVEAMSAENARVFAKSTRVAAYLEGETNRLKTLVSHLRVSNVKLSVDLKNAQTESMRTASLEHRLKISEQDAESLGRRILAMEAELQQKEMKLLEAANTVADDYGYHHNEMLEGKYHAVTEQLKALQAKQSSLLVELNNYKSIAAQSEAESKAAIETLGDQHRFLESDVQRLQSQLHDKEIELRNSHAQVQSCEFNLSKANAQISQLTDQGRLSKDSYASAIAQLQRDLSDREETLRALEDENRALRDQVSKLESDFVTRGGDVASLLIKRFEDDDESRVLRVQLEECRSELLTKKSSLAELEGCLQTTTQEVLFVRQQETQLRTQLQQVSSRLEASSAAEQELQSELDIARADLSQHQSAVADLQEELRLVDLRYSGLEADYVLVKAGAEALESRSEALTGESRLYRQQLDEVTSKLNLSLKEGTVLRGQLEEQAEVAETCRKLVRDNDRRIRELKQLFEAFEQAESEILFEVRQINDDLSSSYVGTEFESVPPQHGHASEGGTGPGRRDQGPTSSDIFASPPLSVVRSPIGAYSTTSSRAIVSSADLQSDDAAGLSPGGNEVTSRQAAALSQLKDIVQSLKLRCSNTLYAFHQTYHTLDRTRSEKEDLQRSLDKLKDKHQLSVSESRVLSNRLERSEEELQSLRRRHKSIEGEKTAWLGTVGDWSQKVSRLMRELDNGLLESIAQANDAVAGLVPISAEALPDLRISESLLVVQQRQQRSEETQESFDQQNLHSSIAVLTLSVSEVTRASDYLLCVIRQLVAEYKEKLQHASSLEAFFEGREGKWEQERRALHTRQSELERLLDEEKHLHSVDEQKLESCLSDLDALQLRMQSVEDSNSSLSDELKVSTAEMEELRLLLHEKDSSCIDLRAKLGVEQEQLQRSEEQLRAVQGKLEDVQRKVTEQELRFEHSNTLLNRLRVEKDALENVRRSMESELDRSRKEVLSLRDAVKQLHEDNRSLFEVEKVLAAVSATVDQIAQLHHIGGGASSSSTTRAAEEQQSSALVLQVSSSSLHHPHTSLSTSTTVHEAAAADRSFVQQLPGRVELVVKKLSQLRNWAREEARNKRLFDSTQESISADLMSARSAEEEAQRQLQTARLHCIQLDKDLKQSLMELHHCRQEMSDMKERLSKLDHSGSSVSALLEHEKQHASSLEEQARLRDASISSLHMELEDTKTQLSKSQDHLRVLTQKLSEVTSESDRRSEHLRIAKSNYEILFNTITQIEKNALSERVEREQTERKYGEAVEQISVLTRYQQRTVELERQVVQMREEVDSTSQAVICSEEKCSKLQSSLSTAQKTIGSLEHRMESLLQQKNSFVDEVSETRKKIALAKQAAEQERMQRLKADAEIALLKKTEEANREHRVLVGRESSASDEMELLNTARGEEERRSLRTKIHELNQVCEEQESKLQSDMNDRLKLEHEVKQLKSTLAKRNAELSSSSSYKSLLRSEGRQARQTVLQAVADIREVLTMVRIDAQASGFDIGSSPDSTNSNKRPATSSQPPPVEGKEMSYEDALPLGLAEALGINDLTLSLDALKAAMSFISESTRSYQIAEQHLKQLKHENTDLLHELQVSEQQRHDLVSQYKQEVQTMHLHITELRRSDSKNPHLVHQISELEATLKAERERRERAGAEVAALKARVELLTKLDSASNQHTHQGSGYSPDLQEALREEVDRMKSEHSDLLHELHAVNHHRTVLRDTLEQLDREVKAKGAALSELQLLHSPVEGGAAAKPQQVDGDDELRRRAVRYKARSEAMDELATIYRSGVLALYPDGASYGAAQYGWQSMPVTAVKGTTTGGSATVIGVGWIEREMNVVKHSYEAEMKLLEAEVGEVRNKLRQANLYTAELRRRFEDNMRAIYRSGKGSLPDGGLLLEQVDEVRAEIDRVSQERAQSMQELQQERMHSRQRHQQLVDSITAALQSRDASLGALHRLELFCRDQGLDLSGLAVYEALKAETRTSSLDISKVPPAPRQQQQVLSTLMKGLVEADHDLAESERRSRAKRQAAFHPAAPAATIVPVSTSLLYANTNNTRSATSLSRDSSTHNSRSNSAARGSRVASAGYGQPLTDDSRQLSPAAPTNADDQQRQAYMQRDRGSPSHEQQLTREFLQSKAPAAPQRQDPPPVYSLPTISGGSGTLRVIHSSTPVAAARQSTGSSAKAHRSTVVPGK